MFAENLDAFLDVDAGFAVDATLDGVAVVVIRDEAGVDAFNGELVTVEPSVLIKSSAVGDVVGKALVVGGVTHTVRSALLEPPDGAFTRLMLARA